MCTATAGMCAWGDWAEKEIERLEARCERAERQLEAADYVCVIVSDAGFDQHLLDDALKDWGALYYAAQPEPDTGGV